MLERLVPQGLQASVDTLCLDGQPQPRQPAPDLLRAVGVRLRAERVATGVQYLHGAHHQAFPCEGDRPHGRVGRQLQRVLEGVPPSRGRGSRPVRAVAASRRSTPGAATRKLVRPFLRIGREGVLVRRRFLVLVLGPPAVGVGPDGTGQRPAGLLLRRPQVVGLVPHGPGRRLELQRPRRSLQPGQPLERLPDLRPQHPHQDHRDRRPHQGVQVLEHQLRYRHALILAGPRPCTGRLPSIVTRPTQQRAGP